jgi:hypothetical protein
MSEPASSLKTVAVVGASTNRSKFGNKAVRAYHQQGWVVYPVNPKGDAIEGLSTYRALSQVPQPIHRVTLYLPPEEAIEILDDIAAVKPKEFFVNPGAESPELQKRANELGLDPIFACSIIDAGTTPDRFPDT